MALRFTKAADRHEVSHRAIWYIVMTAQPVPFTTKWGESGLWYEGTDDQGVDLEVGTVVRKGDEWVVHAMPLEYRHDPKR